MKVSLPTRLLWRDFVRYEGGDLSVDEMPHDALLIDWLIYQERAERGLLRS